MFSNLFGKDPKEELHNLAWYAKRASVALTLDEFEIWEALWMGHAHDEKRQLKRSINNLNFQRDTYLREPQTFSTYLQEVREVLAPFNFPGFAGSQVIHLVRMMEKN